MPTLREERGQTTLQRSQAVHGRTACEFGHLRHVRHSSSGVRHQLTTAYEGWTLRSALIIQERHRPFGRRRRKP